MNPTPMQLASCTMPAKWADEQQRLVYQQQPEATYLLSGQHLQNYNQQMCYHQQQKQLDYHQHQQINYQQQEQPMNYHHLQEQTYFQQVQPNINYHTQERNYQEQLLPTQMQPGQQPQQLHYQFPGQQPMLRQVQQYTQDEVRTLWVGGLQHWMNESYLYHCFSQTFVVCSISLIWNKCLGSSAGYCYVEFASQTEAERALNSYTSMVMPYTVCQPFRLHWASSMNREDIFRSKASPEYPACEGNLAPGDVVEHGVLQEQPQEGPKYSLWEGDLALGFITEPGLLQENPQECTEYSPSI